MIAIDRTKAPAAHEIKDVQIKDPEVRQLNTGARAFIFNDPHQEATKIDLLFRAGNRYHPKYRLALLVNKMLTEGTHRYSAKELADIFDYYGAAFSSNANHDTALLSLSFLPKYAPVLLPVLTHIIREASFPQEELNILLDKKVQDLAINEQKVSFLARNHFPSMLFGAGNHYGHPVEISDYQNISTDDMKTFFDIHYKNTVPDVLLSGYCDEELFSLLSENLSGEGQSAKQPPKLTIRSGSDKKQCIEKEDVVQSAIRIGRLWVGRHHPDYAGLKVLLTLFGGYFGSRLMRNIREDKGYTYGIGAGVSDMLDGSYMFISTEVKKENTGDTLREIYHEMAALRSQKVKHDELELVKNYMIANFLRGFDGPFATADRFLHVHTLNLDFDFYRTYLQQIKKVEADDILRLANQYLLEEEMYELVVGHKY